MAGDVTVSRMGYGAMQLAGPHVFGPPADRGAAVAVLREAVELGITHIDTADFYGPHITNQIIKEALYPYPDGLHIVTKVGSVRDAEGAGPRRWPRSNCAPRSTTICATSVSTHWTWSTSVSAADPTITRQSRARSPSRSRRSRKCGRRG
jgi:aryl-alcohol dehydrogenase-like predicted oxidoreductase